MGLSVEVTHVPPACQRSHLLSMRLAHSSQSSAFPGQQVSAKKVREGVRWQMTLISEDSGYHQCQFLQELFHLIHNHPIRYVYPTHFVGKETEAQRG